MNQASGKLRAIPLGGLGEFGMNMMAFEYGDDIIIVDCGVMFPDAELLGVDIVIPDLTYLRDHRERVRAIVLTHGHEDHIGGLPYVLEELDVPVYGTAFTLALAKSSLDEHGLAEERRPARDETRGTLHGRAFRRSSSFISRTASSIPALWPSQRRSEPLSTPATSSLIPRPPTGRPATCTPSPIMAQRACWRCSPTPPTSSARA